jgi:hypothetical protein
MIVQLTAVVMRGRDPRIHHFPKKMDCQVKLGNDQE